MSDVRVLFPELEKNQRVKRGHAPKKVWNAAPSFEQLIAKLAPTVVDTLVRTVNSHGNLVEMQRYILKSGNKFGYLCFKTSTISLSTCKSYQDLQVVYNGLVQAIKWASSLEKCKEYVAGHCTSPAYVSRVKALPE